MVPFVQAPVVTVVTSQTGFGTVEVEVSRVSQEEAAATQIELKDDDDWTRRVTQQPPSQRLPAQHGVPDEGDAAVPGLPHTTQSPELLQTVPASEHLLPAQQVCPAPPHGTQAELLHVVPGSRHAVLDDGDKQQVCPVAPHALQT